MTEYLLDADVLIGYLRRYRTQVELLKTLAQGRNELAVATITVIEIRQGMRPDEAKRTDALLQKLRIYDLDYRIAAMTGDYLRNYRQRGVTLGIPDTIVAATAIAYHLVLVTYNSAHYPMPELSLHPTAG